MDGNQWFVIEEVDEGDEPWDFDTAELAFVTALHERAASWTVPAAPSHVGRPEDDSSLMVLIGLLDNHRRTVIGEWAAHFHGSEVRAGEAADQLFTIRPPSHGRGFRATGTPENLAARCAEWFESLLARPVVRTEWIHDAAVYATAWEFADTGEGLARGLRQDLAPASGWSPRMRHDRCFAVRGGTRPRTDGQHSELCPHPPRALKRWGRTLSALRRRD